MYRQSEKNLLSSNISPTCPHNMVNFGPLAAEIVSLVWGTPGNFNGFRVLAGLLHGTLVVGVSQTAALNKGRHLYSAGRPSRWALAHISSFFYSFYHVGLRCVNLFYTNIWWWWCPIKNDSSHCAVKTGRDGVDVTWWARTNINGRNRKCSAPLKINHVFTSFYKWHCFIFNESYIPVTYDPCAIRLSNVGLHKPDVFMMITFKMSSDTAWKNITDLGYSKLNWRANFQTSLSPFLYHRHFS